MGRFSRTHAVYAYHTIGGQQTEDDGSSLLSYKGEMDILFLDIQMREPNGIEQKKFFEVLRGAVEERKKQKAMEITDKPSIAIKKDTVTRRVYLYEIIYLEVFNRTVIVHTADEDIAFYGKLTELENSLSKCQFSKDKRCI